MKSYLSDIDRQAEEMLSELVRELTAKEGITEKLKAADQMAWVRAMNAIYATARDIVNADLIYV